MFELIRPIPPIAWIPLTVFWFGIGLTGKVFIIWIAGIVPCVINSYVGVRMTSPVLIQMARTYGASDWQIFCQLCIPSALLMVFGALQLALAYCWTNLVAAELLAADSGLGFLITMGGRLGRPDIIVCARHGARRCKTSEGPAAGTSSRKTRDLSRGKFWRKSMANH